MWVFNSDGDLVNLDQFEKIELCPTTEGHAILAYHKNGRDDSTQWLFSGDKMECELKFEYFAVKLGAEDGQNGTT